MEEKYRDMKKIFLCIVVVFLYIASASTTGSALAQTPWEGAGTLADPYLLYDKEDLLRLQELVNSGEHFEEIYFQQQANIDLSGITWIPIGLFGTGCYFDGIYDGNGYYVENLYIETSDNNSFFGQLGGVVMNFGIENGEIHGKCVGSITSHAKGSRAKIINCYNRAGVYGARAGGIADNFNGYIFNCWTDCILEGERVGDIYSYAVISSENCYTNNNGLDEVSADVLNKSLVSTSASAGVKLTQLNSWETVEGKVVFSSKKRTYHWADIPQLIVFNYTKILLAGVILFQIILLVISLRAANGNDLPSEE